MIIENHIAETEVKNIKWSLSRHGIYKPIVQVKTTVIDNVKINNVTGNNAKFLLNNNIGGIIGPGAKIVITRSGGVIPKIIKVIEAYSKKTYDFFPKSFKWNSTKTDILIDNKDNEINDLQKKKK